MPLAAFALITARVSKCNTDWLAKLKILSGPLEKKFPITDLKVSQDTEGKGKKKRAQRWKVLQRLRLNQMTFPEFVNYVNQELFKVLLLQYSNILLLAG